MYVFRGGSLSNYKNKKTFGNETCMETLDYLFCSLGYNLLTNCYEFFCVKKIKRTIEDF